MRAVNLHIYEKNPLQIHVHGYLEADITLDRITHHRLNQVISVASELADGLVDVDLALLLELLDERVDGDEGAGSADAGGAMDRDGSVLPRLVDAFDESDKLRKLWMIVHTVRIGYGKSKCAHLSIPGACSGALKSFHWR